MTLIDRIWLTVINRKAAVDAGSRRRSRAGLADICAGAGRGRPVRAGCVAAIPGNAVGCVGWTRLALFCLTVASMIQDGHDTQIS